MTIWMIGTLFTFGYRLSEVVENEEGWFRQSVFLLGFCFAAWPFFLGGSIKEDIKHLKEK